MSCKNNFSIMPFSLKIVCLVSLVSPVLVVASTLSGAVTANVSYNSAFGNANNFTELVLLLVTSVPTVICGLFVLMRKRAAIFLFPVSYLILCLSPLVLEVVRSDINNFIINFSGAFVVGGVVSIYFFLSRESKDYFSGIIHGSGS